MSSIADLESRVAKSIQESIDDRQNLLRDSVSISSIARASEICVRALKAGNKLIFFGNGGSAADAQHIAAEFVGRFRADRPALPALALTVNTSCLTAISNDYGFEHVFVRQLEALARPGDVAIGLSTSGNSKNVLLGISTAKRMELHTIALTGAAGGELKRATGVDLCVCFPSSETPRVQEGHILLGHMVCELVEQELYPQLRRIAGS